MGFDAFLKIDGIDGESAEKGHEKHIDVLSFSWGVAQQGQGGQGSAGGKVNVQDFAVVKKFDTATPKLFEAACKGQHLQTAVLTLRRAGGDGGGDFFMMKMTDVTITSLTPAGSAGSDTIPMEQVSFNFSKVEIEYKPQLSDGRLGDPIKASCIAH